MGFRLVFLVFLFIGGWSASADLNSIQVGAGAEYNLAFKMSSSQVSIYFTKDPKPKTKSVEMYFTTGGGIPIELWQRFHLTQSPSGKMKVEEGYIHSMMFQTRKLDKEYLQGFDGVQMSQFLVSSREQLQRHFLGSEAVTVPAGTVTADHYRIERAGQVIDFWIHHEAKPIGLVKLISSGTDPKQNYSMQMTKLLKNVAGKIDTSIAQPMDEKTKSFLPKPKKGSSGFGLM